MGANDKREATYHPLKPDSWPTGHNHSLPEYPLREDRSSPRPHPIEKFTAPPETVLEHLDRIGVKAKQMIDENGNAYWKIPSEPLLNAEERIQKKNPQEDQNGNK